MVGKDPGQIVTTPSGKTAYVLHTNLPVGPGAVTPISLSRGTAGQAIRVGNDPIQIALTPSGRTVYVLNTESATVTPISTATNTPGRAIKVGYEPPEMAITPDGKDRVRG